jgi:hypothetical protein
MVHFLEGDKDHVGARGPVHQMSFVRGVIGNVYQVSWKRHAGASPGALVAVYPLYFARHEVKKWGSESFASFTQMTLTPIFSAE